MISKKRQAKLDKIHAIQCVLNDCRIDEDASQTAIKRIAERILAELAKITP